jgi:hypothetical protein
MSYTRMVRYFNVNASKLNSIGSVRTIYSCSQPDELRHWLELHMHHTDGHKHHHGALFDHHGHHIFGSRGIHTDTPHSTTAPKQQVSQVEHSTSKEEPALPAFKAW